MDIQFFQEIPYQVLEYTKSLEKEKDFEYYPSKSGLTKHGELLSLGFSSYALKIYFMSSEWQKLTKEKQLGWVRYINSFQGNKKLLPKNSYIDSSFYNYYHNLSFKNEAKFKMKEILNFTIGKNYETKKGTISKSINAETKQAVATLFELGHTNEKKIENIYEKDNDLTNYLESLNWAKPWSAGAQFSSLCVFSKTQDFNFESSLEGFITKLANSETGSYYTGQPKEIREVINGAMKVISGLDWLDVNIHYPEKLIDFCLDNTPVLEGCDIVDFIYVLYKSSKQSNHRRREVNELFKTLLLDIKKLYFEEEKGFSYFLNKSQTHYYGVEITKGDNVADLHGSILCLWGVLMILETLDSLDEKFNIIKP